MAVFAPQPFQDDAAVPSRIKVLVAGVGRDERRPVEATVRGAFAGRDPNEVWSVSLVRLGATWAVVLNGPTERLRHVSFSAEQHRLAEAIREALREPADSGAPTPSAAPEPHDGDAAARPPSAPSGGGPVSAPPPATRPSKVAGRLFVQDHHVCGSCQKGILVSYESEPDEQKKLAAVACPHCWKLSRVPIGAWAVEGGDYKAEKA
jgi:hypothetical protein